jgi:membrane associated rhomboid family serine protease
MGSVGGSVKEAHPPADELCTGYYFMAPTVLAMVGNTSFLALYLGGGLISSAASLLYHDKNAPGSQGASGKCLALISSGILT